jgi:hypothetical protein
MCGIDSPCTSLVANPLACLVLSSLACTYYLPITKPRSSQSSQVKERERERQRERERERESGPCPLAGHHFGLVANSISNVSCAPLVRYWYFLYGTRSSNRRSSLHKHYLLYSTSISLALVLVLFHFHLPPRQLPGVVLVINYQAHCSRPSFSLGQQSHAAIYSPAPPHSPDIQRR